MNTLYYESGKFHAKIARDGLFNQYQRDKKKTKKWLLHSMFDLYIENIKRFNRTNDFQYRLYFQGYLDELQKEMQQYLNNY